MLVLRFTDEKNKLVLDVDNDVRIEIYLSLDRGQKIKASIAAPRHVRISRGVVLGKESGRSVRLKGPD